MPITNFPNGITSFGTPILGGSLGVGNIYNVVNQTDNAVVYADIESRYGGQTYDNDGSAMFHNTIPSALAATVECRNDYVVVWPQNADYDITAVLTMDKKSVHLVCPAGMSYDIGATNACRVEQTTSSTSVIDVADAAVEVAGFYFKPYTGVSGMTLAAGAYAPNIHHNYFVLRGSVTATGAGISAASTGGTGGAWGQIERNKFESQVSSATYAAIIKLQGGGTACGVHHNFFNVAQSIATIGISQGNYGSANFNIFTDCGGSGSFGAAIDSGTTCGAIGNRGAIAANTLLNGGTASDSFCDNLDGATFYNSNLES